MEKIKEIEQEIHNIKRLPEYVKLSKSNSITNPIFIKLNTKISILEASKKQILENTERIFLLNELGISDNNITLEKLRVMHGLKNKVETIPKVSMNKITYLKRLKKRGKPIRPEISVDPVEIPVEIPVEPQPESESDDDNPDVSYDNIPENIEEMLEILANQNQ